MSYDFRFRQGRTVEIDLVVVDRRTGQPWNLAGATLRWVAIREDTDTVVVDTTDIDILDALAGEILLTIVPADTDAITEIPDQGLKCRHELLLSNGLEEWDALSGTVHIDPAIVP